jgi:hypothetical protein
LLNTVEHCTVQYINAALPIFNYFTPFSTIKQEEVSSIAIFERIKLQVMKYINFTTFFVHLLLCMNISHALVVLSTRNNSACNSFQRKDVTTTSSSQLHAVSSNLPNILDNKNVSNNRIQIDESFNGLQKIYSNPDIFVIRGFLDKESCQDLIIKAQEKTLDLSPVAYAGKTEDKGELMSLAAKGPVAWLSILTAWYQSQSTANSAGGVDDGLVNASNDMVQFGIHLLENYALFLALAYAGITAFLTSREEGLQSLRTSTSTTLDNLDDPDSGTSE